MASQVKKSRSAISDERQANKLMPSTRPIPNKAVPVLKRAKIGQEIQAAEEESERRLKVEDSEGDDSGSEDNEVNGSTSESADNDVDNGNLHIALKQKTQAARRAPADSDGSESDEEDEAVPLFKAGSNKFSVNFTSAQAPARPDVVVNHRSSGIPSNPLSSTSMKSFSDLGLDQWICDNLARIAITRPTPVQLGCIPPILAGKRTLSASAPTGSGKTAAFALPILDKLARDPFGVFALVLTPTRELALQIGEQFSTLGAPISVRCEVIIGGVPLVEQQLALAKCPHVVVATPGRMATHVLGADPPKLNRLRFLVLDESDRLLTRGEGFEKDLARIGEKISLKILQTLLFSATSGGVKDIATAHRLGLTSCDQTEFQWDYAAVGEDGDHTSSGEKAPSVVKLVPATLTQTMSLVPSQAKHAYMAWFIKTFAPKKMISSSKLTTVSLKADKVDAIERARSMIVFTSTCEQCQLYCEMLQQLGISCVAIHGELHQKKRMENLNKFRAGAVPILIATDVASRGLDIPQVDVVLNLDVPREPENYVHRIGRCARAGRLGRSFLFVTQNEVELVKAIEHYLSSKENGNDKVELDLFEIDDDDVTQVLHKASVAKRKAVMKLHDDGFLERIKIRKDRRRKRSDAD